MSLGFMMPICNMYVCGNRREKVQMKNQWSYLAVKMNYDKPSSGAMHWTFFLHTHTAHFTLQMNAAFLILVVTGLSLLPVA